MAFGNYIKAKMRYGQENKEIHNYLYFSVAAGTPSLANIDAIATDIKDDYSAKYAAVLSTDCSFFGVNVQWFGSGVQFEGASTGASVTGTSSGTENLPEEDCVVIRRTSGKAGRSKRGRIFVGWVPESLQDESRLTSTGISAYQDLAYQMKIVLVGATSGVSLQPKTPDFKNAVLEDVLQTYVVVDVLNRRDRRNPKELLALPAPA